MSVGSGSFSGRDGSGRTASAFMIIWMFPSRNPRPFKSSFVDSETVMAGRFL